MRVGNATVFTSRAEKREGDWKSAGRCAILFCQAPSGSGRKEGIRHAQTPGGRDPPPDTGRGGGAEARGSTSEEGVYVGPAYGQSGPDVVADARPVVAQHGRSIRAHELGTTCVDVRRTVPVWTQDGRFIRAVVLLAVLGRLCLILLCSLHRHTLARDTAVGQRQRAAVRVGAVLESGHALVVPAADGVF